MVYAEFYTNSTGWNGKDFSGPVTDVPMCGSDGVSILDGRYGKYRLHVQAKERLHRLRNVRTVTGYRLMRGEKFTTAKPISDFVKV